MFLKKREAQKPQAAAGVGVNDLDDVGMFSALSFFLISAFIGCCGGAFAIGTGQGFWSGLLPWGSFVVASYGLGILFMALAKRKYLNAFWASAALAAIFAFSLLYVLAAAFISFSSFIHSLF